MKKTNYRLVIVLIVSAIGLVLALPSFTGMSGLPKVKLGLDLQGGLHMTLGVKSEEAIVSKVKNSALNIHFFAEKNDILIDPFKVEAEAISFTLLDKDAQGKIDELLAKDTDLEVKKTNLSYYLTIKPEAVKKAKEFAINQAVETIRNRLDQFGLAEPSVTKTGYDNIVVELPGVKTIQEEQRARELVARTAKLEIMAVDEAKNTAFEKKSDEELKDSGNVAVPDHQNPKVKYVLKETPVLDGSMLTDAQVGFDQKTNMPIINFSLDGKGAEIFGDYTGKNVGTRLAIVLDGKVYSAPVIRERIGGGHGQISGSFTPDEAHDLAIALRSGALPASVVMLEKRSVGPSLGADSINQSLIAFVTGAVLVFGFLMFYYGFAGIIANVALVSNIILIIAIMALFEATLTLPGMAGLVLTIGMSVDANVIINERIRELLRRGIPIKKAVEDGYDNAMSAIVDSNVTAIIAAVAMYIYGTGPVKGFAIVMAIGILVSMLTAIVGTHGTFLHFMPAIERSRNLKRWFGLTDTIFTDSVFKKKVA